MGQNAVYIAIDDDTAEQLWELDDEPFRARFLEIEEDRQFQRLDIAKIWDALHCTLTGVPASRPIEDDKLSEAIVGVHPKIYVDEDYSMFVSIIDNSELEEIITALGPFNDARLTEQLNPALLEKQNVYPTGIWNDDPRTLVRELADAVTAILTFFDDSKAKGLHVLATIM